MSAYFRREPSSYSVSVTPSVEDMWTVEAEFTLAGNMVSELSQGPRARPKLSAMRVEYIDRSLNTRVTEYCSRLGLTSEQIVAAQLDKLSCIGQAFGIEF